MSSLPVGGQHEISRHLPHLPLDKSHAHERAATLTGIALTSIGAGIAASQLFKNRQIIKSYVKNLTSKVKLKTKCTFEPFKVSCKQGLNKLCAKFPKAQFESIKVEFPQFNMQGFGGDQVKKCIHFMKALADESSARMNIKSASELLKQNEQLVGSVIGVLVEAGALSYLQDLFGTGASEAEFDSTFRNQCKQLVNETEHEMLRAEHEAQQLSKKLQEKCNEIEERMNKESCGLEEKKALLLEVSKYQTLLETVDQELQAHIHQKKLRLNCLKEYLQTSPKEAMTSMEEFTRLSGISTTALAVGNFVKKVAPGSAAGTILSLLTQATLDAATHTDHTHEKGLAVVENAFKIRAKDASATKTSKETAEIAKRGLLPTLQESIPTNFGQKGVTKLGATALTVGLGKTIEEQAAFTIPKNALENHVSALLRPISVANTLQNRSWENTLNRLNTLTTSLTGGEEGSDHKL
jgi:hypothetical protein